MHQMGRSLAIRQIGQETEHRIFTRRQIQLDPRLGPCSHRRPEGNRIEGGRAAAIISICIYMHIESALCRSWVTHSVTIGVTKSETSKIVRISKKEA